MIIGFDVGGTNARGLMFDPATGDVAYRNRESSAGEGPHLLRTLVALVDDLQTTTGHAGEAIGLGVAGLAARSGIIHYSPNLPDLVEYPLGTELQAALDVPVTVMNDASAGAWAEAKLGAGRGATNLAFVALGTGIGTGFVVDGTLVLGHNGFAGESGHMVIDMEGPAHITGQQGPWEFFASGSALGRLGREAAAAGRFDAGIELAGEVDGITGFTVAAANTAGDDDGGRILDGFCRYVALGCANLVMILDPHVIVVGGGLTGIGEPLRAGVEHWLGELLLGGDHRPLVEVRLAELGDDAGALGAALMAQEGA